MLEKPQNGIFLLYCVRRLFGVFVDSPVLKGIQHFHLSNLIRKWAEWTLKREILVFLEWKITFVWIVVMGNGKFLILPRCIWVYSAFVLISFDVDYVNLDFDQITIFYPKQSYTTVWKMCVKRNKTRGFHRKGFFTVGRPIYVEFSSFSTYRISRVSDLNLWIKMACMRSKVRSDLTMENLYTAGFHLVPICLTRFVQKIGVLQSTNHFSLSVG